MSGAARTEWGGALRLCEVFAVVELPPLRAVVGTWGPPEGAAATCALVFGILLLGASLTARGRVVLERAVLDSSRRAFLWGACGLAAALSLGYVAFYLRGGPRIIDATTYLLEARGLAAGSFRFPAGFPSASTRGRFLLYDEAGGALGGIFPPGYPLLLSLGVRAGAPMVVGPLLAAALVAATRALGVAAATELGVPAPRRERIGRAAALFSVTSACARYHTADTMSHGASALYVACGLVALLGWRQRPSRAAAACAGLALGALVATRPVSALPLGVVVTATLVLARRGDVTPRARLAALAVAAVAVLPGLALLLAWQRELTGSLGGSPQLLYYARSDGPSGCFRYGFGRGVGCLFEHGDFVRHNLAAGYGPLAVLGTTARRLKMHLADAANLELLFPLVLAPLFTERRRPVARLLGASLGLQVLAYAPFYFDGNYPGGGARFFADTLPVEHALLALTVSSAWLRPGAPAVSAAARAAPWLVLAVSLVAFSVHARFDHDALADREGGAPFYVPDLASRQGLDHAHERTRALVFVDTDHGFALGHIPTQSPASADARSGGPVVLRRRDDDHDWLAFVARGRPESWVYRHEGGSPRLSPWAPTPPVGALRFEAEADWPPLAQDGGYALPSWMAGAASGDRVLTLTPTAHEGRPRRATMVLALPAPSAGAFTLAPRVLAAPGVTGHVRAAGAEWAFAGQGRLVDLPAKRVDLPSGESHLVVEADGGDVALDRVLLAPIGAP